MVTSSSWFYRFKFPGKPRDGVEDGKHTLVGFIEREEAHDNMEKILSEIIYSENQAFPGLLV